MSLAGEIDWGENDEDVSIVKVVKHENAVDTTKMPVSISGVLHEITRLEREPGV